MAPAIQIAGLGLVVALAVVGLRPEWRLAAIVVALLSVPGNVDNLLPQFSLDPHDLANNTGPVVSAVDALLGWAVALTVRERRAPTGLRRSLTVVAVGVAAIAAGVAVVAL
ncbi:MAG: hypothetical protein L0227_11980, partial [Chloroflexi bacterium]|nr:hypothetical protein [Chloroflexota bacterium]